MNRSSQIQSVNYIGDSHSVLTFGQTILPELQKIASVHFLAFAGLKLQYLTEWMKQKNEISVSNFEKRPDQDCVFSKEPEHLGATFEFLNSDWLVVALGTNDIVECANRNSAYKSTIQSKVNEQLKKIAKRKVVFIEPPKLEIANELDVRESLLKHVGSFGFSIIPSKEFKADQADGIHMKKEMAADFGEYVAKELLKLILPHH